MMAFFLSYLSLQLQQTSPACGSLYTYAKHLQIFIKGALSGLGPEKAFLRLTQVSLDREFGKASKYCIIMLPIKIRSRARNVYQ